MKKWTLALTVLVICQSLACQSLTALVTPDEGLKELIAGNERFVKGDLLHPKRDDEARAKTAPKQAPYAVIVGCSDSRVPPEILFDQGIGDLFIV
ncbi:MAG TPA: carbonic anhydrase, partial [Chlamydiales bacterium]|nr:carbonic anhydrase [Chlamydiales bacterium]